MYLHFAKERKMETSARISYIAHMRRCSRSIFSELKMLGAREKWHQFPTHATVQSITFISIIFLSVSLHERRTTKVAPCYCATPRMWVRDVPVIHFEVHTNCMRVTCLRVWKMLEHLWYLYAGYIGTRYDSMCELIWGVRLIYARTSKRERIHQFVPIQDRSRKQGNSANTCVIIICHWN